MRAIRLPILTCGVYVVYSGSTVVYVGKSNASAFNRLWHAVRRFQLTYTLTEIRFYGCESAEKAHELEGKLIRKLKPLENQNRTGDKIWRVRSNRMPTAEEQQIFDEVYAVVKRHRTTMKRVNRIMLMYGQRTKVHRGILGTVSVTTAPFTLRRGKLPVSRFLIRHLFPTPIPVHITRP